MLVTQWMNAISQDVPEGGDVLYLSFTSLFSGELLALHDLSEELPALELLWRLGTAITC